MMRMMQDLPSRTRVYLNGEGLADIDPAIHVHDISYASPSILTSVLERARNHGGFVTRRYIDGSKVTIQFDVREYDPVRRQEIMRRICAWAMKGGVLKTDDRPEQQLRVICTQATTVESALRWTARQSIEFSAFERPFWEDVAERSCTLTGTSGTGTLYGPGNAADPFVEVRVQAQASISSLTVYAGATKIALTNISLSSGQILEIAYDNRQTLRIRNISSNVSYLSRRSDDSDDDLTISVGRTETVSFSSNGAATVTFKTRGLYL